MLDEDPRIANEGKAIEIKITARRNQVSIDALLASIEYLTHMDYNQLEITPKNMLSYLVTANFLGIPPLEKEVAEFVGQHLTASNIVDALNISAQVNNWGLVDKCYYVIKAILLYRMGLASLPKHLKDDPKLELASPNLIYNRATSKAMVRLDIFRSKADESVSVRAIYHVFST